jgi:hypothetical protein
VARLAELHADDGATRTADPRELATALVVLAPPAQSTPAPTLAAAATDAVQRIHRLLGPAEPLGRVRRHLLRATAAILALAPVLVALSPAVAALALGRVPAAQQGARPRRPRRRVTGRVTVVRRVYRRPAASRRPSQ